jgi:hypothetical protein
MPSEPTFKKTPQNTYAKELTNPERGYPLYIPEPYAHHPEAYRQRGIQIGDVGVRRQDGGFDYIFSIACTEDDPINKDRYGVPSGFEVYSPFLPGSNGDSSHINPRIVHAPNRYSNKCVIKNEHMESSDIELNASAALYVRTLHT